MQDNKVVLSIKSLRSISTRLC